MWRKGLTAEACKAMRCNSCHACIKVTNISMQVTLCSSVWHRSVRCPFATSFLVSNVH